MRFAQQYLGRGYNVIPLPTRQKAPPPTGWNQYAQRPPTDNEVRSWWTRNPTANIGAATGAGEGFFVVDLDGPKAREWGHKNKLYTLMTVTTGREDGGLQLWYRWPESGTVRNSASKLAEGVDVSGEGGYGILPPSVHPNGRIYSSHGGILPTNRLPVLPRCFLSGSTTYTAPGNQEGWIAEALKDMRNGNIDTTLHRVCSKLRADGYAAADALVLLQPHAVRAGATPGHLEDKIKNAWARYQPNVRDSARCENIDEFLKEPQTVEWICQPFIAKQSIGFVAGLPETCKTWTLMDLAVECATGRGTWLGLFPVSPARVLFIDQERFKGETQRRFTALIAAKGLTPTALASQLSVKCGTTTRLDSDQSYQAFRAELSEYKPDLVIVDSFATFHGAPENDRMAIQGVLNRIKALRDEVGCSFIFINHESKMVFQDMDANEKPSAFRMMGSVGVIAAAEFCLTVRKLDDGQSIIHHTKSTLASVAKSFYASVIDTPEGVIVKGTL